MARTAASTLGITSASNPSALTLPDPQPGGDNRQAAQDACAGGVGGGVHGAVSDPAVLEWRFRRSRGAVQRTSIV